MRFAIFLLTRGSSALCATVHLMQTHLDLHTRYLSTEFVHNYVDRGGAPVQTPCAGKGLRHAERVFANQHTPLSRRPRRTWSR
jgi:hypothetical protein